MSFVEFLTVFAITDSMLTSCFTSYYALGNFLGNRCRSVWWSADLQETWDLSQSPSQCPSPLDFDPAGMLCMLVKELAFPWVVCAQGICALSRSHSDRISLRGGHFGCHGDWIRGMEGLRRAVKCQKMASAEVWKTDPSGEPAGRSHCHGDGTWNPSSPLWLF